MSLCHKSTMTLSEQFENRTPPTFIFLTIFFAMIDGILIELSCSQPD